MPGVFLESVAPSGMDAIIGGLSSVTSVIGEIFSLMTSNPLLLFFLACSLVGAGIGVFRKVKGASH